MATELCLDVGIRNDKTIVTKRYFTSPLKLGMPVNHGSRLQLILMMASAGMLKGDEFVYDIQCAPETKLLITEQSYTKVFDTGDGGVVKKQHIRLQKNASLYYRPSAVIPFANSTYDGDMLVELDTDSEFAWADIMTAGRVGMQEHFAFRHYRNRICVQMDGIPVWMDHCLLEPASMDVDGMLFFDGYTHQGTFYYYGTPDRQRKLKEWRPTHWKEMEHLIFSVTEACQGICVRILAHTAQDIEEVFADLAAHLQLI